MTCSILIPGLSEQYRTGGLLVTRDLKEIFEKLGIKTNFIATHEKHPDALETNVIASAAKSLFITTWGPLVSEHIKLIHRLNPNARILYYAQSFGWNIKVPSHIPIICVSRYVMSQWALAAPGNFITHIPPRLNPLFRCENKKRDIDIFVHTRKQNDYCLKKLLPALHATHYRLHVLRDWIPQSQFADFFNRTKIFLYLTGTHKAGFFRRLPAEGFGLPALEALACGATVGSNLLGGVTDFLIPGENCIKLQNSDLDFDVAQIKQGIENFRVDLGAIKKTIEPYQSENVTKRWKNLFDKLRLYSI